MRTLRVLLAAPPDLAHAESWIVVDTAGNVLERGTGGPHEWPAADRREAVIAADAVRIVSIALPPLPAARVPTAARYALEDRLAGAADESAIAVGTRDPQGHVLAIVFAREFADALHGFMPAFDRAVAESQLAHPENGWRWCESADASFVRTQDGGAFSVSRTQDAELPTELALALAQAVRADRAPPVVIADRVADAPLTAQWETISGVPFRAGLPWRWETASVSDHANAIDILAGTRREAITTPARRSGTTAALGLIALALLLHVFATLGTWAWRHAELARVEAALVPIAREAGAPEASIVNARTEIARLHAHARHRAGLSAPGDALPMLARAASALAALPAGTLRSATFSGGAWTLELAALDDGALGRLVNQLAASGLGALYARHPGGVRARITPAS